MRPGAKPARLRGHHAGSRAGIGDPLRDAPAAALGLRAQAARGVRGRASAGCCATCAGQFLRLGDRDAAMLRAARRAALAGRADRVRRARVRGDGPARVARLLADLGERGCSPASSGRRRRRGGRAQGRLRRGSGPHMRRCAGSARASSASTSAAAGCSYPPARDVARRSSAWPGVGCFVYLVLGRYGTPFVVARSSGSAGAVFVVGRFAVRGRARARARAHDGVVRPARRPGGPQGGVDLPVRVRGHVGGVVRAPPPADRDRGRGPGVGLRDRRPVRRCCRRRGRDAARGVLPARVLGLRRGAVQSQPVPGP